MKFLVEAAAFWHIHAAQQHVPTPCGGASSLFRTAQCLLKSWLFEVLDSKSWF
jgi:hypothetical protein